MHYIHTLLIHHLSIGGWFKRMKLIEVKSLIWAQKGKLYIIYENVMWIQWPTILVWWQKKRYCSDMPNVVSAIDGTSHEIQIPSNEPQALVSFKKYMPPLLPYFKVSIYPFLLPHFASIFFAYLWSFRWPNYIVTLPRYFSFRLPHLNISTGPPQTNWARIFSECGLLNISVNETDTTTSGLRWIFHMPSEFSRSAMCNNATWLSPLKCKVSL